MNHSLHIRRTAEGICKLIFPENAAPQIQLNSEEVLKRLEQHTGIGRCPVSPQDTILQNSLALINPSMYSLFYNADLPDWFAAFCQAHEYAHLFLHHGTTHCSQEDINLNPSEDAIPIGENRIAGYSARERKERDANLFALELLLPNYLLRQLFIEENWRAADFVKATGLPFNLVCQQLAYSLLIADEVKAGLELNNGSAVDENLESLDKSNLEASELNNFSLDSSQKRAASATGKRLLIEAGPGTGKTRALVGRILHLLETGVSPEKILALTFSNKAAEEMRERIARFAPDAAPKIWLGTFHAFGLELLRKHATSADISESFNLLDPVDAQILLENHLLELNLEYYRRLYNPAKYLKSIHGAIQRAKDELKSCDDYQQAARVMLDSAQTDDEVLAAQKAMEVARVYRYYEQLLRENGWLDFGDLIYRAVMLLKGSPNVKQLLQAQYSHILVDEFQDVNRASSMLVQELAGDTGKLWIVGDARQTVYRWRGASSANLRQFKQDFADAETLSLEVNYRSESPIIDILNEFAPQVVASEEFSGWTACDSKIESKNGNIRYWEMPDFSTECHLISEEISKQHARGKKFREIAILGRTNGILAKIAEELTARNIPILYLGNMFERDEIRDLLSLLALTFPSKGRHLVRFTGIPEYDFSTKYIRRLIAAAEDAKQSFPEALELAQIDSELTLEEKAKFALLEKHLLDINDESVTAWQFLSCYLFDRSQYLLPILEDHSVKSRQKQFAIYQLLQFALGEENKSARVRLAERNPRKAFLQLIRHLAQSGEESAFRKLPSWAENIDAVPLLTVHAAKGLEFPTVFMPYLSNGYFPSKRQGNDCPLPSSLTTGNLDPKAEHQEEELCLFFVALSRAQETLILSCAPYNAKSKPSDFLKKISKNLPPAEISPSIIVEVTCQGMGSILNTQENNENSARAVSFAELKTYLSCPRRYYYEYVLNLRGNHDEAAYLQLHIILREVITWAKNEIFINGKIDSESACVKLLEIWNEKPLRSHAYAPAYLDAADTLVRKTVEFLASHKNKAGVSDASFPLEFKLDGKRVKVTPDFLEVSPDGRQVFARKVKTGKAKEKFADLSEDDKLTIAALYQSAKESFPEAEIAAYFTYLESGAQFIYDPKNINTQLNHLKNAVLGIAGKQFDAKPNSRQCPACAHYFICPGGEL